MSTSNYKNVTHLSDKALLLIKAAIEHWSHLQGKHLHHIKIVVPIDNDCSASNLNELVRKLVNSKQSINCVDNRSFFNSNFDGGCYILTIRQDSPDSQILAVYDLLCLTDNELLESVLEDLHQRLIKVFPDAQLNRCSSIELLVKNDLEKIMAATFSTISTVLLKGEQFHALDKHQRRWVMEAIGKDIREFGQLYLMVHQPYNL